VNGYLNRKKAAEYVGCSVRKFDLKIRPHLAVYKFGGTPMFRTEEIDAWAASQQVVTSSRVAVAFTGFAGRSRARKGGQRSALEHEILRKLEG
jgi:hypothetical protein